MKNTGKINSMQQSDDIKNELIDKKAKRKILKHLKSGDVGKNAGQTIGAVVGVVVGSLLILSGFGAPAGAAMLTGWAAVGFVAGAASVGASIGGLLDPPKPPSFEMSTGGSPTYSFGPLTHTVTNALPVAVLYGSVKLAGNVIWQSEAEVTYQKIPKNIIGGIVIEWEEDPEVPIIGETIYRLQALCEGEINSVSDIRVNDIPITELDGCNYNYYLGTTEQTIDERAIGYVDGLKRTAYIAYTLKTSDDLKGGNPVLTCLPEGLKVKTWDDEAGEFSSEKSYSRNPAECVRDYLTNTIYGMSIPESWIDGVSFGEVAEYCDTLVDDFAGGTEKRFQLDFIADTRRASLDILNDILATFGGFLSVSGERIKLRVEHEDEISIQSFNMDNIIDGSFGYSMMKKSELPNKVIIQYVDPDYDWQKIEAIAEDKVDQDKREALNMGESVVTTNIQLFGIIRFSQASRMARRYLRLAHYCGTLCTVQVGIGSLFCEPGDIVTVSHDVSGWVDKPFRILSITESEKDVMQVLMREYLSEIYDDRSGSAIPKYDYGTVPNPFYPVTNVTNVVALENGYTDTDGTYVCEIDVTWDAPTDASVQFLDYYRIELKKDSGSYVEISRAGFSDTAFTIRPVEGGYDYTIRVKTVSINSITSSGTVSAPLSVVGQATPPGTVQGLSSTFTNEITLWWSRNSELDVINYEIRTADSNWGTINNDFVWSGDSLRYTIVRPTARSGVTYYVKAKSRSGLYSAAVASVSPENAAPAAPTVTLDTFYELAYLSWSDTGDVDLLNYEVYKSTNNAWAGEEILFQTLSGTRVLLWNEQRDGIMASVPDDSSITTSKVDIVDKADDYYNGGILYISNGDDLGSQYTISDFAVSDSVATITITNTFNVTPTITNNFTIMPKFYYKVRGVDTFGAGSFSSAITVDFSKWSFSGFQIQTETITETKIADDAISTPKLCANSVTSDKIAANNVLACHISVANLAAICADVGELTAGIITGLCIRTASSGERVEMVTDGFRAFDETGCCCSYLSAGALMFHDECGNVPYVKRIASGQANTGATVCLPGWKTEPEVLVSVKSLYSYNKDYASQSQQWEISANNVQCYDSGGIYGYSFDVHATLRLAEGQGTECIKSVNFGTSVCTQACVCATCVKAKLTLWCNNAAPSNYYYGCLCYALCYRKVGDAGWCALCYSYAQPAGSEALIKSIQDVSRNLVFPCSATWEIMACQECLTWYNSGICATGTYNCKYTWHVSRAVADIQISGYSCCNTGTAGGSYSCRCNVCTSASGSPPAEGCIYYQCLTYRLCRCRTCINTMTLGDVGRKACVGAGVCALNRINNTAAYCCCTCEYATGGWNLSNNNTYTCLYTCLCYCVVSAMGQACVWGSITNGCLCQCSCCDCTIYIGDAACCDFKCIHSICDTFGCACILDPVGVVNYLAIAYT